MKRIYNLAIIVTLCCLVIGQYKTNEETDDLYNYCNLNQKTVITHGWSIRNLKEKKEVDYQYLQDISVTVQTEYGLGTGVLFIREVAGVQKVFVWTAGHVVYTLMNDEGSFNLATIKMESRCNGKFVNTIELKAKVIAFSDPYYGDDLALLEITEDCCMFKSAIFADNKIQPVGTEIIHVGSVVGWEDSVSLGIISQTDRELSSGKMYDQTSCMAYPGSSGGGVYTTDCKCIGLLTNGVGAGLNFFVPMRRIRAWAKKAGVEWALDQSVPVPLVRAPTSLENEIARQEEIKLLPPGGLE